MQYITGKIIGRGKSARVYKVVGDEGSFARKEFSPIQHVRVWNWFFYHSPHPLITEAGRLYSYWKRKVAHRLCASIGSKVRIPDAIDITQKGFTSEFVEGRRPSSGERRRYRDPVRRLEAFFADIGMPTWSFSRKNPFACSNFLVRDDDIFVIDYEQSVPVPDSRGRISYDIIEFGGVDKYISENRQEILLRLGQEETERLSEALELSKAYYSQLDIRPKNITKVINFRK